MLSILFLNETAVSLLVIEIFLTISIVNLLIDVADLFIYNCELRKYFSAEQMEQTNRPGQCTKVGL
jgi:hypothetical protein